MRLQFVSWFFFVIFSRVLGNKRVEKGTLSPLNTGSSRNEQKKSLQAEPCRDRGEAFSGAWITTFDHVMSAPMMKIYLQRYESMFLKGLRKFSCEEASYFVFHGLKTKKNNTFSTPFGDYPHQTVDLFDFSVLHLSAAERLIARSPALRTYLGSSMNCIKEYITIYYCPSFVSLSFSVFFFLRSDSRKTG
jgi:hypothetical protein